MCVTRHDYVHGVSVVRACADMSNDVTFLSDSRQQMFIPGTNLDSVLSISKRGFS